MYRYFVGRKGKLAYLRNHVGVPVIIDVFRASSTIVVALASGAEAIYPVESVSEARLLARRLGALLAGERRGVKVRGFDFGNSPTEMLEGDVDGKRIVLTTTMGTRLMVDGGVIASTLNASRVVAFLRGKDVDFLVGGRGYNLTCVDDLALAKVIENMLVGSDYSEWLGVLRDFGPSEYLLGLGYGDDVELICNGFNRFPILPVFRGGKITKLEDK
jgi:2-phosphosulfolactate phosphatase